jgi:hypothetical protein
MVPIIDRYEGDAKRLPAYLKNNASFMEAFDAAVLEFEKGEGGERWYDAKKMADGGLVRKMADGSTVTPEAVRLLLEEQDAEEVALEKEKQTLSYWKEENPMALDVASEEYTQVPINVLTEEVFNKEYKGRNAPFDPAGVASGMTERYLLKPLSSGIETVTFQDPVTYYKDDELMKSHILDLSALLRLRLPESVRSGSEGGERRGMAVELADRFDARLLEGRHKVPSEVARVIKLETLPGLIKQLESIQALQEGSIASDQGAEKINALTYLIAKFGAAAKFFANEGRGSSSRREEILRQDWTNRGNSDG